MRKFKLAFRLDEDDRFIVMAQASSQGLKISSAFTTETTYGDEDLFLKLLIYADLDEETTRKLVVAVILSVANPKQPGAWIAAQITPEQNEVLGINLPGESLDRANPSRPVTGFTAGADEIKRPYAFQANAEHFYDFLSNAPTPFAMLAGPEHTITFINPSYARILGRVSHVGLLGLPVREAIPELDGQPCFALLDQTFRTGLPQVRKKLRSSFRQQETGLFEEVYFDIVYHPVRDASGNVCGVMAQATDVSERVLAREVSDNREQKLYRLWAELEAIYAAAPLGIAIIEASDLRLLRLNKIQAALLGAPVENLVGSVLSELPAFPSDLLSLIERAAAGERVADVTVEIAATSPPPLRHRLSVSVRPALNAVGLVETLTLISLKLAPSTVPAAQEKLLSRYSA